MISEVSVSWKSPGNHLGWICRQPGKPVMAHCRKIQAVTTLCQSQCGMVEVCTVPGAVAVGSGSVV